RRVVADDERGEVRGGFLHGGVNHLERVAADRVHLRMELETDDAVAQIDEARARVALDDARLLFCRLQQLQRGRRRRKRAVPETVAALLDDLTHERRGTCGRG